MNRYQICQSKRGRWYVKLQVNGKTFVNAIPFFDTREEAEELARKVAYGRWMDASLTYGGSDA